MNPGAFLEKSSPKDMFVDLEREEGGERERQRENWCGTQKHWSVASLTGEWNWNLFIYLLICGIGDAAPANWASPPGPKRLSTKQKDLSVLYI